jgi:hypothetical protein
MKNPELYVSSWAIREVKSRRLWWGHIIVTGKQETSSLNMSMDLKKYAVIIWTGNWLRSHLTAVFCLSGTEHSGCIVTLAKQP